MEQLRVPASAVKGAFSHGVPDRIAPQSLEPGDSGFTAAAAFGHALDRFQGMEVVAVHATHGHAHHFLDLGAVGHVKVRHSPGDGQR